MEDKDIIALYWARSEEAIRQTSEKYGAYCRAIARNILPDRRDAEECVNDTWLGAWNAMPENRPGLLAPFLGKITRNLAWDTVRARTARKRGGGACTAALEELGECVPSVPGADQVVEDRELAEMVNRFLHTLGSRDCSVFLRRYWYAEPLEDIGERYGLNVNTVKTILFRTRKKLKAYLEKEGVIL